MKTNDAVAEVNTRRCNGIASKDQTATDGLVPPSVLTTDMCPWPSNTLAMSAADSVKFK